MITTGICIWNGRWKRWLARRYMTNQREREREREREWQGEHEQNREREKKEKEKTDNGSIKSFCISLLIYFLPIFISRHFLSIFTNNHYNSEYKYFNIQEQIIISMMLEGHSREGTNASPFHDSANNFRKQISQSDLWRRPIYLFIYLFNIIVCSKAGPINWYSVRELQEVRKINTGWHLRYVFNSSRKNI